MIAQVKTGRIVVTWDFSKRSHAVLERAIAIAEHPGLITVLHVAPTPAGPDNGLLYDATERHIREDLNRTFRKQIQSDMRMQDVQFRVVFGRKQQEIAKFADAHGADVIVMPPESRRGIARFWGRDLTDEVASQSVCPVLVLDEAEMSNVEVTN